MNQQITGSQRYTLWLTVVGVVTVCLTIMVAEIVQNSASESRARARVVGRYRLRLPGDYQGDYQPTDNRESATEYWLSLNQNGTVQIDQEDVGTGRVTLVAQGTWKADGDGVILEIEEHYGRHLSKSSEIHYEMKDGFPVIAGVAPGDALYMLKDTRFTIGAGERHPLVQELHRRLAGVGWLGYRDPDDDLYTEETRKAVVAFQLSQGLHPSGEVDEATWELLGDPNPPLPTPTPLPSAMDVMGMEGLAELLNLPTYTEDGRPIVYLTFDDGPSEYTQQVLGLLARYDAKATFFVVGEQVEFFPGALRMELQAGHTVGNHSYDHTSLAGLSQEGFLSQIGQTEQAIVNAAGDLSTHENNARYLRPPYGLADDTALLYAAALGYDIVLWDVDPQDWRRPGARAISDYILSNVFPGVVVLMHDGGGDCTQSVQALATVLSELSAQRYAFHRIVLP